MDDRPVMIPIDLEKREEKKKIERDGEGLAFKAFVFFAAC
jgi:hypothetical protein